MWKRRDASKREIYLEGFVRGDIFSPQHIKTCCQKDLEKKKFNVFFFMFTA